MSPLERVYAAIVGVELSVMGWCVWALWRTYRSVKGKHG